MDIGTLFIKLNGRISRQTFWISIVLLIAAQIAMILLLQFTGPAVLNFEDTSSNFNWVSGITVILLFLWPTICVLTKRLHDCGKSGWWQLILFIPIIGLIWFIIQFGLKKGTAGRNHFGADPLPKMSPFDR